MKTGIHPEYVEAVVTCSCGETFTTRATKPKLQVELCSKCHPFYTGKQKLVDSGGRVQRFQTKWGLPSEEERAAAEAVAKAEEKAGAKADKKPKEADKADA